MTPQASEGDDGIELTRISLRPLYEQDARRLSVLRASNRKYTDPYDRLRSEEFFTEESQMTAITRKNRSTTEKSFGVLAGVTLIGQIGLSGIERDDAEVGELGYWIDHQYNGRGLATRAVGLILEIAFNELGLHRVTASVMPSNAASQAVLLKCGFREIGLTVKSRRIRGKWEDHLLFERFTEGE